ncbi:hypothetical protein D3C87_1756890 [compost metagenome]
MPFQASSGNFASITSGGWSFGMRMVQSGRAPLESVVWKAKAPIGRPSATIVSMRDWPKAPRVCLFERMACSPAMSFASDWMLFWAVSITARRSCNRRRFSCVALVCSLIEAPIRCVMPSIRWLSVWFNSA